MIFITENDVLKKNLSVYHIVYVIQETGEYFGNEAYIIYVNGAYQDDILLGILVKDMRNEAIEEERINLIKNQYHLINHHLMKLPCMPN